MYAFEESADRSVEKHFLDRTEDIEIVGERLAYALVDVKIGTPADKFVARATNCEVDDETITDPPLPVRVYRIIERDRGLDEVNARVTEDLTTDMNVRLEELIVPVEKRGGGVLPFGA